MREGEFGDADPIPPKQFKAGQGGKAGGWLCLNWVADAQAAMTHGQGHLCPDTIRHSGADEVFSCSPEGVLQEIRGVPRTATDSGPLEMYHAACIQAIP